MKIDFGIDFGTTNSACIGILDNRRAIRYTDGFEAPFPSVVIIDKVTGEVVRGREAWNRRQELSESGEVFTSIKSYLGTGTQWIVGGQTWTPEMVAAQIFIGLKTQVLEKTGDIDFDNAVVAIPVGFPPEKRKALRKAAEIAGIRIKSFVSESTAAIFHSFEQVQTFAKIAVFDWGGGTLDISVAENWNGSITEVAVGNEFLGGDDIDLKLARWVHNQIEKVHEKGLSFEEMPARFKDLLIARCEAAKKDLSYIDIVEIRLNRYGDYGSFKVSIDIDTFSDLISPELQKALNCMEKTLNRANLNFENLGCVLLVGGSINLRPFIELIETEWNCHKIYPEDSEWSVAQGAARLSFEEGKYVMGESIGVMLSDGGFYPIVKQGSPLKDQVFTASFAIVEDTDTANVIFSDDTGTILGYSHVPTFGFFKEQIDVQIRVDQDLVLHFSSRSKSRGDKYQILWSYPGPKLRYKLPGAIEEVTNIENKI